MKTLDISKWDTALLLGVALAASPALADRGGNGGNGGAGGGSSHAGGNGKGQGADHSKAGKDNGAGSTDTDTDTDKPDDTSTVAATKTYGTINGFLHASKNGLLHASSNSAIGRVRDGYVALATTATSGEQLLEGLQAYSKKPVTKATLLATNQKLADAGLITTEQLATLNGYANALP